MLAGCLKTGLPTTPGERSVLFSWAGIWCFPTVFTATDRIFAGSRVAPPAGSDFRFSQTCTEPQTITQSEKQEPFLGRTPAAGVLFFAVRHGRIKDHRVGAAFPVICFSVGFCFFLSDAFSFRAGSDRRGGIDKGMPRCYNNIRKETRITGNKRRPEKEFFLS